MSSSKALTIQDFIFSSNYIHDTVPIREVKNWFDSQPLMQCLAVLRGDKSVGLLDRASFYETLYHAGSAGFLDRLVAEMLPVSTPTAQSHESVQQILERFVLQKIPAEKVFQDIPVLNEQGDFLGIASMRSAVTDSLEHLSHRVVALEAQQTALTRQNKELFEGSFRQGQRETQYRSYFDHTALPYAIFDDRGKLISANIRFHRLIKLSTRTQNLSFSKLFQGDWSSVLDSIADASFVLKKLELNQEQEDSLRIIVAIEKNLDWGHYGLTILESPSLAEPSAQGLFKHTSETSEGKITQAIRAQAKQTQGLGRTVANNLIDKENQVDRLMKKLDQIFTISAQIEQLPSTPPSVTEIESLMTTNLTGMLSEFSVIDLCQILIQGTKTGQLLIYPPQSEELQAYLYFYCGSIVHAKHSDGFEGESAIAPIVKIRQGTFEFIYNKTASKTTIQGDPMGLLMDACRVNDERRS